MINLRVIIKKAIPFLKLVLLISFTTIILFFPKLLILIISLFIELIFLTIGSKWKQLRKRVISFAIIGLFLVIFHLLFSLEKTILLRISTGIISALKLLVLSLAVLIYTVFVSSSEILKSLFFLPKRIRLIIAMALSLLPVFFREYEKISISQASKAHKKRFLSPLKSYLPVIIPLIHRTLTRSEKMAIIMHSKGFDEK